MDSPNRRKAVRRAAATLAVTTTAAPVLGVVMTGHGLPWAFLPIGSVVAVIAARTHYDATPAPADPEPEPVRPRVVYVMGSTYAEDDPPAGERPDVITAEYYWSEEVA